MVEKALGRPADLSIAYDKSAAQQGDNFGEPLGGKAGPLSAAADTLVGTLTGRRTAAARRSLFGLFGGRR